MSDQRVTSGQAATSPPTQSPVRQPPGRKNPGAGIDYHLFLDCVHCGLCTASCPTYIETGNENDSPRGRIYLMRAVTDGRLALSDTVRGHLDLCLDCRGCETSCPSGVQYGRLIEPFRIAMDEQNEGVKSASWLDGLLILDTFPYPDRLRRALAPARIAQRTGLLGLAKALRLTRPLPEFLPAKGEKRARVALFTGCVGDVMFRHTHWATARVLQENGCDVVVPRGQACCGAIHFHAGASEPARELADQNVASFDVDRGDADKLDAVIVNVAGCGAMLREYAHHWHDDNTPQRAALAAKVRDIAEFLDELGLRPPTGEINLTATYHDPCHLAHAQKVREAPRRLLAQVPGLKLVGLVESDLCCGAAGTYNLTQPEMSARLAERKLDNIIATGAAAVFTGNAGCLLQVGSEARRRNRPLWIAHPIEVLDLSYRHEPAPDS
jgi:glycolate oxidase iron-sulfur subunit